MRKTRSILLGLALLGIAHVSYGFDRTGVLGLNYTLGPSFILGGDDAQDAGSVQPGVGAALQMGIRPNLDVLFSYDYLHADLHTQAITFGGQFRFAPEAVLCPFAGGGIGFGKPFSGEGWDHFSIKLLGGLEKSLTPEFSLAALMTYHYVDGTEPFGSVHSFEPGVRLIYYFGQMRH